MKRAELGIDGTAGFALLGADIQVGEAEFVDIDYKAKDRNGVLVSATTAELIAAKQAFKKLAARLEDPEMSFFFGPSHPFGD